MAINVLLAILATSLATYISRFFLGSHVVSSVNRTLPMRHWTQDCIQDVPRSLVAPHKEAPANNRRNNQRVINESNHQSRKSE